MKNKKLVLILSIVLVIVIVCVVVACVVISKNSDEDSSSENKSTSESKEVDNEEDNSDENEVDNEVENEVSEEGNIIDTALNTYNNARNTAESTEKELEEQEIEVFNARFELYEGNTTGGKLQMLIREVIASNASNEDYPVEIEFEGTTYSSDSELNSLKTSLRAAEKYTVSFKYTKERISKIIIE